MVITEVEGGIVVEGVKDFSLSHIFECGQAFRWNRDEDGYIGIVQNRVIRLSLNNEQLLLENCCPGDFSGFWRHYLDLDRDYTLIKQEFSRDPVLNAATAHGWGVRILNQDPWETLISFIISANNNITRIKKIVDSLSMKLGTPLSWRGRTYYTFPDPAAIAEADEETMKACGCGYRGPYIQATARRVLDGGIDVNGLKSVSSQEARAHLLGCMGVGDKVAECIMLFSLEKTEAFPVDVWVKRVMEHFYTGQSVSAKQIKAIAAERFGKYAGLAQQYLFYYAREQRIGK